MKNCLVLFIMFSFILGASMLWAENETMMQTNLSKIEKAGLKVRCFANEEGLKTFNEYGYIKEDNLYSDSGWVVAYQSKAGINDFNEQNSQLFKKLKQKYGEFTFTYIGSFTDPVFVWYKYVLKLDTLVNCNEVADLIRNNCRAYVDFINPFPQPQSVPNDRSLNPNSSFGELQYINPVPPPPHDHDPDFYDRNFHKRGWAWHHYSIKTPLAWEITMGQDSYVLSLAPRPPFSLFLSILSHRKNI